MTGGNSKLEAVNGAAWPLDKGHGEEDNNDATETSKVTVTIETEIEKDDWIPDGGWGWGVVVGAVIIHVYVGKLT